MYYTNILDKNNESIENNFDLQFEEIISEAQKKTKMKLENT